jgi:hypothetical protein
MGAVGEEPGKNVGQRVVCNRGGGVPAAAFWCW